MWQAIEDTASAIATIESFTNRRALKGNIFGIERDGGIGKSSDIAP